MRGENVARCQNVKSHGEKEGQVTSNLSGDKQTDRWTISFEGCGVEQWW